MNPFNRPMLWITVARGLAYVTGMVSLIAFSVLMLSLSFTLMTAILIELGQFGAVAAMQEGAQGTAGLTVIAILGVIVLVAADFRARQIANRITGHRFPPAEG